MNLNSLGKSTLKRQFIISILMVVSVSIICFIFKALLGYKVVALVLLMTVSVIAMLFDIVPVMVCAALSAVIWNYFFIPPLFTLDVGNTEDFLMFLLYFFVAMVNAVLTFKIKQVEKKARLKEEQEKEIKLYNTLLNSLSHELRTPIATIIGSVDVLKDNWSVMKPDAQMDLLTQIELASERLNRQVENLLNMSRLESGNLKPKYDWCDLCELVNYVIQKMHVSDGHIIDFTSEENLPLFKLDAGFMEQIVFNLLFNALVYTPNFTHIRVNVCSENDFCVLTITDDGPGFPDNYIERVFDKFFRLPNTQTGGSGLGLSIVKGFVESQNGTISLTNRTPHGAHFVIKIPAETSYLKNIKNE